MALMAAESWLAGPPGLAKPLMRPCLVAAALAAVLLAQPAHPLPSSFLPDGTVLHGGKPFFPLGLYAENGVNPWDVVPVLRPPMTGQQLAQRLVKSGWNTVIDYGIGTAGGSKVHPELIREFFDGLHNVGMTVIMNLDVAMKQPLDPETWYDNTTKQALDLSLSGIIDHPGLLALGWTDGGMENFQNAKGITSALQYIQQHLDIQGHVFYNGGMVPPDSFTYVRPPPYSLTVLILSSLPTAATLPHVQYLLVVGWQRNDLHKGFCPENVLANPAEGCMWNGKLCGGNNETVCGPEYYEVFDNIVPKRKLHGGGGEDQFAFGAQQYDYPASPEAFNATCQRAQWAHLPGGSPCMNATTNGLRDPAQEGQACIHGDCWSFGYNTQMMNLSAGKCESQIGTSKCSRTHRHSVWPVPIAFPWSTAGWRDPDGPADGPCLHWNMEVGDFQAPSATMMENIAWQSVANGANGLVFYSLMDNLRPLCCHVSRLHNAPCFGWPTTGKALQKPCCCLLESESILRARTRWAPQHYSDLAL